MSEPRLFIPFTQFIVEDAASVLVTMRQLPVTTDPHQTRFLLPDGTRLTDAGHRTHEAILRRLGLTMAQVLESGVIRYVPNQGVEAAKMTSAQAHVIADDWNIIYGTGLSIDRVTNSDVLVGAKTFYDASAEALRYFVNSVHEDVQMAVASANLQSFRYDETTNVLTIRFRSGGVYRYDDVPADIVDEMRWAESRGRYFWRYIRTSYTYTQIEAPRPGFSHAYNTAKSTMHQRHTLKVPKFIHKLPRLS